MRSKIYLAAPLFSEAERAFNERLECELSQWADVFRPQRDGNLNKDLLGRGISFPHAKEAIFKTDVAAIRSADLVITVLDGATIDEGVAVEAALAYAWGKPCWALKTDFRSLSSFGDNPMVEGLIERRFDSVAAIVDQLADTVTTRCSTQTPGETTTPEPARW